MTTWHLTRDPKEVSKAQKHQGSIPEQGPAMAEAQGERTSVMLK